MATKKCFYCGRGIDESAQICPHCGAQSCPVCGAPIPLGFHSCPSCGHNLSQPVPSDQQTQQPTQAPASHGNRRPCPYCGEEIMVSAVKCRFCGEWLTQPATDPAAAPAPPVASVSESTPVQPPRPTPTQPESMPDPAADDIHVHYRFYSFVANCAWVIAILLFLTSIVGCIWNYQPRKHPSLFYSLPFLADALLEIEWILPLLEGAALSITLFGFARHSRKYPRKQQISIFGVACWMLLAGFLCSFWNEFAGEVHNTSGMAFALFDFFGIPLLLASYIMMIIGGAKLKRWYVYGVNHDNETAERGRLFARQASKGFIIFGIAQIVCLIFDMPVGAITDIIGLKGADRLGIMIGSLLFILFFSFVKKFFKEIHFCQSTPEK